MMNRQGIYVEGLADTTEEVEIMEGITLLEGMVNEDTMGVIIESEGVLSDIDYIKERTQQLFSIIELCTYDQEYVKMCQNDIIELNIKLVSHILKKCKPFGDDEFQTGCLGLILATHSFNPKRGVPFASYACFCIERELHKAHKKTSHSFEYQMGNNVSSLDELISMGNGDEVRKYETIADPLAEGEFEDLLSEYSLNNLFESVIRPSIEQIAKNTNGQSKINYDEWVELEMRYLLEMAAIESQKGRLTLSAMARQLGLSIQNLRMRHQRVLEIIRITCIESGIHL